MATWGQGKEPHMKRFALLYDDGSLGVLTQSADLDRAMKEGDTRYECDRPEIVEIEYSIIARHGKNKAPAAGECQCCGQKVKP